MDRADDIALRAKIRHDGLMARRDRLEALAREVATYRDDLRILASDLLAQVQALGARGAEIASRLRAQIRELDQEDTTIALPTLPPEPRLAPTDRLDRRR